MKIAQKPHKSYHGKPQSPHTIVLHALAEYIDVDDTEDLSGWEQVDKLKLAVHFYVTPSGVVLQSLPLDTMGAHAKGHNIDTVGIEFLVSGLYTYQSFVKAIDKPWLTPQQLQAGKELIQHILDKTKKYGTEETSITTLTSHHFIDPDRKFDPGLGFPYGEFREEFKDKIKTINF